MDEIFVVLYAHHKKDPVIEQGLHILEKFNLKPHKIVYERPFDWARVTQHYNETKMLKPDDWWIVADDDELQLYSKPTYQIIEECEEFGYEFVTGGFVDRVGEDGTFPEITLESDIWKEMPNAGFFRYPLSYACPNKVTLMKGNVQVSNGQHYVQLDDTKTTCQMEHPKRYPIEKNFTQVHHFKWDSSVLDRLQQVGKSSIGESWGEEYQLMYDEIEKSDFKIDLTKEEFMFQRLNYPNYHHLKTWDSLKKKIVEI
jgi:hypothetical protein